jgi:hypothetical protein
MSHHPHQGASGYACSSSSTATNNNSNNLFFLDMFGSNTTNGGAAAATLTTTTTTHNNNNTNASGTLTRTLLVHIAGSRVLWESLGIHGGVWQVSPDRASAIFLEPGSSNGSAGGASAGSASSGGGANNAGGGGGGNNGNNATGANGANLNNNNSPMMMMMGGDMPLAPNNGSSNNMMMMMASGGGGDAMGSEALLMLMNGGGAAEADRLTRALVRRVTLLESHTNIDETIAVHIEGLPPREFTANGHGASFFLTGEGRCTQPQELFSVSGNAELGLQWMRLYPRYTSENLEKQGVMCLTGASYYFVHQDHPSVHYLRANEEQFGLRLAQEPSLDGGWIRIDVDTFSYTVKTLREKVLRNTPATFNLSKLTVRVAKADGQTWGHIPPQNVRHLLNEEECDHEDPVAFSEARSAALRRYFDRPLFLTLRLCIEYVLPDANVGDGGFSTTSTTTTVSASSSGGKGSR